MSESRMMNEDGPGSAEGAVNGGPPHEVDSLRPVAVEAREGYRIWLRYADGVEGEVDLSHLVGTGVFKAWEDPAFFERVHIDDFGSIAWSEELDMCPDALYMDLTGKSPEEIWPGYKPSRRVGGR